jgi:hypothetical protein
VELESGFVGGGAPVIALGTNHALHGTMLAHFG